MRAFSRKYRVAYSTLNGWVNPREKPIKKEKKRKETLSPRKRTIINLALHGHKPSVRRIAGADQSATKPPLSKSSVHRLLSMRGFSKTSPIQKPEFTKNIQSDRVLFAKEWVNKAISWVIFADESTFRLNDIRLKTWGEKTRVISNTSKYSGKINLWAANSHDGLVVFHLFKENMNSDVFIDIMKRHFLPKTRKKYGDDYVLMQYNDSKHNSKQSRLFYSEKGVEVAKWPAKSPDLNPIKNFVGIIESNIYPKKIKDLPELELRIKQVIATVPRVTYRNLINSFPRRLE